MKRIFLVEDDETIAKNLMRLLRAEDFAVLHASTREEALSVLNANKVDLALLDISLPDGNGFALCTEIKETQNIPVIFLTASGDEASVVTGLYMGAEDYITKPFRPRELIARIKNALRKWCPAEPFELSGLAVDTATGIVKKDGSEIYLSPLEYRLLLVFINNPQMIITRGRLLDELWDAAGEFVNDNTLTVYIKRLREKIEPDPSHPQIILTVRGTGYRLGMDMLRNREFRQFVVLFACMALFFVTLGFFISKAAGILAIFFSAAAFGMAFLGFTKARYKSLAQISEQIDQILHHTDLLYLSDAEEGELSILQSEITKMTLRILEQNDALKKKPILPMHWRISPISCAPH